MKHYHVMDNAPGYLPEADPVVVSDWNEAKEIVSKMLDEYEEADYVWQRVGRYVWQIFGADILPWRIIQIQECEENREDCKVQED